MIYLLEAKVLLYDAEALSGQGIYRLIDILSHNSQEKKTLEKFSSIGTLKLSSIQIMCIFIWPSSLDSAFEIVKLSHICI